VTNAEMQALYVFEECFYVIAPVDKMAEVLRKTSKEAKDMISKVSALERAA